MANEEAAEASTEMTFGDEEEEVLMDNSTIEAGSWQKVETKQLTPNDYIEAEKAALGQVKRDHKANYYTHTTPSFAEKHGQDYTEKFTAAPPVERLRIVMQELVIIEDFQKRFYDLLERRALYAQTGLTNTAINAEISSQWTHLLRKVPILMERTQFTRNKHNIEVDSQGATGKLISEHLIRIVSHCPLLWIKFEDLIRTIVLVNGAVETLVYLIRSNRILAIRVLDILLDIYGLLPQVRKVVVESVFTDSLQTLEFSQKIRLLQKLQSSKILPKTFFSTLNYLLSQNESQRLVIKTLNCAFKPGSLEWFESTTQQVKVDIMEIAQSILNKIWELTSTRQANGELSKLEFDECVRALCGLYGYLYISPTTTHIDLFWQLIPFAKDAMQKKALTQLFLVIIGNLDSFEHSFVSDQLDRLSNSCICNQFIIISAYLLTQDIEPLEELISSTMGMDFVYPRDRLFELKDVVSQEYSVFSLKSVAQKILSIPVINHDEEISNYETIHSDDNRRLFRCVLRFIQNGIFQREGMDLQLWFARAIELCSNENMSLYIQLIKQYISACFSSTSVRPLPELVLKRIFAPYIDPIGNNSLLEYSQEQRNPSDESIYAVTSPQVLGLLYLLYYNDQLLTFKPPLQGVNGDHNSISTIQADSASFQPLNGGRGFNHQNRNNELGAYGEYSDNLVDSLPVGHILKSLEQGGSNMAYQDIWPEILSLAVSQYPDQMSPTTVMSETFSLNSMKRLRIEKRIGSVKSHLSVGEMSNFESRLPTNNSIDSILLQFSSLPSSMMLCHASLFLKTVTPRLLSENCPDRTLELFIKVWDKLHTLSPRYVNVATINSWKSSVEKRKSELTIQDLWLDPLVIFRCDFRVFERPLMTKLFINILREQMAISRSKYRSVYQLGINRNIRDTKFAPESFAPMLNLQEVASLQIILETISLTSNPSSRKLLFQYMHSRFIDYRIMLKLLHFQTYDRRLIPLMVENVPSMHTCYEFIKELLGQPNFEQQMFAVDVAAHLFKRYPIEKSMKLAKDAILQYFHSYLNDKTFKRNPEKLKSHPEFCETVVHTVVKILKAFPNLEDEGFEAIDHLVEFNRGMGDIDEMIKGLEAQPLDQQQQQQQQQQPGVGQEGALNQQAGKPNAGESGPKKDEIPSWKRPIQRRLIAMRSDLVESGFTQFRGLELKYEPSFSQKRNASEYEGHSRHFNQGSNSRQFEHQDHPKSGNEDSIADQLARMEHHGHIANGDKQPKAQLPQSTPQPQQQQHHHHIHHQQHHPHRGGGASGHRHRSRSRRREARDGGGPGANTYGDKQFQQGFGRGRGRPR
ncbi:hypothetical protein H4219_001498 [Mycoemilia scoparia]|uniref:Uncharacterized protein n=1 Tax=Mycoemilia scoparia TaxID=417184 RepID=A0A9W8A7Y6_9FUNG|nr:hypothetical protein H4219_001498 [Mycoemilia scoparia]